MAMKDSETHDPNGIFAGSYPVETAGATVAAGADLSVGAVLGRVTASGKYVLSAAAAEDGSETPAAILLADAAAGAADAPTLILLSGAVDPGALSYGAGHDADTVETAFRAAGRPIFLKPRTAA